jgi:hypothetical protein
MIVEYDDLRRDLMTALSLLEDELTDAEAWELYARIAVLSDYENALLQLRDLAARRGATHAAQVLAEVARRAGIGGEPT